jgi:hypothetical protein
LEEKLAILDPEQRIKREKQMERNRQTAKAGTAQNTMLKNCVNTIEL